MAACAEVLSTPGATDGRASHMPANRLKCIDLSAAHLPGTAATPCTTLRYTGGPPAVRRRRRIPAPCPQGHITLQQGFAAYPRTRPDGTSNARKPSQKGDACMRHNWWLVLAVGVLAVLPATAQAQEKKVNVSFGGGFTIPNSDVRDHFGDGYNFNFGVQVNVTPIIAIEGLYSFNGLGDKDISVPVFPQPVDSGGVPTDLTASMNMQYGTASVIVQAPEGSIRPYGLVGMGVY